MLKIGYARTSTVEQVAGLEAQVRDLTALGCKKIFQEQLSSVDHARPALEAAIDYCREGDVLVCTKLDRLARSVADVVRIEERLRERGAPGRSPSRDIEKNTRLCPKRRTSMTVVKPHMTPRVTAICRK
jgi:DNA invertase Pin-like site-specific DNA recombinase